MSAFSTSSPCNAVADQTSFGALFEKAEYYRFRGLWSQSIACYKKALLQRSTDFGYLTHAVEAVVARDPFNPDGHIALGLTFQNSLEPHLSKSAVLTDWGQAELEYRQAISLSPKQKNSEASALLSKLPSLRQAAELQNRKDTRKPGIWKYKDTLYKKLMLSRWKAKQSKRFYLTRIHIEYNYQFGELRAIVEVPSSSPEHDELALEACQSVLDDFRLFDLDNHKFQFASQDGRRWLEHFVHGNTGKLALLSLKEEPIGNVGSIAREYITSRWTEARIADYCRSDTKLPECMQHRNPPVGGLRSVTEGFGLQLPEQFRPAFWVVGALAARPVKVAAVANCGKWILEYGSIPARRTVNDDFFLMHRINDAIFLSLRKYELAHIDELGDKWKVRSRAKELQERLVRNDNNKVVAYKCRLTDGAEVTVNLKNSSEIENILVNGQPDAAWNKAYEQREESLSTLDKLTPDLGW